MGVMKTAGWGLVGRANEVKVSSESQTITRGNHHAQFFYFNDPHANPNRSGH